MFVYLCLCLTHEPKLSSLKCLHACRGCLAPTWEDPAQKSLSDISAPLSYRWSGAMLTSRCMNLGIFSLQIISLLYQLNLWVVYRLYPSNLACLISNSLKSWNIYQSWSRVVAQQDQISYYSFYLVISLVKTRRAWKLKQESHARLSSLVNLCFFCAMSLPWTTLVDS